MRFFGKIHGTEKDYYIVEATVPEGEEDAVEVDDEGKGGRPATIGVLLCMSGVWSGGVGRFVRFFKGGCGAGVFGAGCGTLLLATIEGGGLFK